MGDGSSAPGTIERDARSIRTLLTCSPRLSLDRVRSSGPPAATPPVSSPGLKSLALDLSLAPLAPKQQTEPRSTCTTLADHSTMPLDPAETLAKLTLNEKVSLLAGPSPLFILATILSSPIPNLTTNIRKRQLAHGRNPPLRRRRDLTPHVRRRASSSHALSRARALTNLGVREHQPNGVRGTKFTSGVPASCFPCKRQIRAGRSAAKA